MECFHQPLVPFPNTNCHISIESILGIVSFVNGVKLDTIDEVTLTTGSDIMLNVVYKFVSIGIYSYHVVDVPADNITRNYFVKKIKAHFNLYNFSIQT